MTGNPPPTRKDETATSRYRASTHRTEWLLLLVLFLLAGWAVFFVFHAR